MQALVLVDIQNDFMPFGALPVPHGDAVVPVANTLMQGYQVVVATQDWHPPFHASFASAHPGLGPGETVTIDGQAQVLWPDHCVQGTAGASFHSVLDVARVTHVVRKGSDPRIDSYSGFFDNRHLRDTGLAALLRDLGVADIIIAGLATDYCVRATALDAVELGFGVTVVADGCRAVDLVPGDGLRAIEGLLAAGCKVVDSGELLGR